MNVFVKNVAIKPVLQAFLVHKNIRFGTMHSCRNHREVLFQEILKQFCQFNFYITYLFEQIIFEYEKLFMK